MFRVPIIAIFIVLLSGTLSYLTKNEGGPSIKFIRQSHSRTYSEPITPAPVVKIPDCSGTCEFRNSVATQYLMSCNGICVCAAKMGTATSWSVNWNGTICTISESGPCGNGEHGMVMGCQPELECIEKRCREPSRVGALELGWACDDSFDCKTGLACVSDENSFPIHKTCRVLPKSLFRIWK